MAKKVHVANEYGSRMVCGGDIDLPCADFQEQVSCKRCKKVVD